jgi:cyclopropane fatty-acyl-phospholipid synthase-like methyltransferase
VAEFEKYEAIYGARHRSTMDQIAGAAFGDERPYALAPASFITSEQLRRIAADLHVSTATLVDLGCGSGGSGLWLAKEAGASVVGVDLSDAACEAARRRAAADFPEVQAEFRAADMAATGLPAAAFDAVVSIDAVQIAPKRLAVFREAARILRPRSRIVLTTFDHSAEMPPELETRGREIVRDSGALLRRAGFEVLVHDELPDWPARGLAMYHAILEQREAVAAEVGSAMVEEAEWGVAHAHHVRRVYLVASLTAR